jgi:hypothetical protein
MRVVVTGLELHPIDELQRHYCGDFAAAMGAHAIDYARVHLAGQPVSSEPSRSQQLAAADDRRVMRTISLLTLPQRVCLRACYTQETVGLSKYGVAAGAVHRAYIEHAKVIQECRQKLLGAKSDDGKKYWRDELTKLQDRIAWDALRLAVLAHDSYVGYRLKLRERERAEARLARDAGNRQREVAILQSAEHPPSPRALRVARVAAALQEMGLVDLDDVRAAVRAVEAM